MELTAKQKGLIEELRALREEIEDTIHGVQPVNVVAERERAEALKTLFDKERELEDELGEDLVEMLGEEKN